MVRVSGNEANPLVPGSPGITFDFKIKISDKGEMCLTGSHDGYPAYEIYIYREGQPPFLLHGHDPRITGENERSLFPPAEHSVRRCK